MNASDILMPLLALIGWTFLVLFNVPFRRFRAAFKQQVGEVDFRIGESRRVPPEVAVANRNFMNLLEVPVLFYVVCIVYYVTDVAIASFVPLAWTYVGLRVVHSLIHLTYNKVMHRMFAFAASTLILVWMWTLLFRALA